MATARLLFAHASLASLIALPSPCGQQLVMHNLVGLASVEGAVVQNQPGRAAGLGQEQPNTQLPKLALLLHGLMEGGSGSQALYNVCVKDVGSRLVFK